MDTIGSRLRHVRTKAGFSSARSAALRFGWAPSTYAAHENGQNEFDNEIALKYSRAFKADPIWLMMGDTWYKSGDFVPIIGIIKQGGEVQANCVFRDIMIDSDTVSRQSIIAIARVSSCTTYGMVAFQIEDESHDPAFVRGDLLLACPMINTHSMNERVVCELEDGKARLCRSIDLKNVHSYEKPLFGSIRNLDGSQADAVSIAQGWVVLLISASGAWSLYPDTDPTWANALSAVQHR